MSIESHYGNQNIIIQRTTRARSTSGGSTDTWATYLTVDGLIRPLSAKERMFSDRITDDVTHMVYTAVADIKNTDRIKEVSTGNIFRISGDPIDPNSRGHHFEIMAERQV